ncbi:hypothetical protein E6H27_06100 [Candidatus Bathyarchaeota archaeon]|nr:MAG: hypothetical protein E6H27_06100 [Candidatus Bathyarchaeota archaeon]
MEGRVLLSLTRSSTCTRYAQISVEQFPITGSIKPSASSKKMIVTYFGYVTLGILLAIALIGAYYLGK